MGYISCVLSPAKYILIPRSTAFTRLVDPCILTPTAPIGICAPLLTPGEISPQKITFDNHKRNECHAIEVTFRNQMIEAIAPELLQPI